LSNFFALALLLKKYLSLNRINAVTHI